LKTNILPFVQIPCIPMNGGQTSGFADKEKTLVTLSQLTALTSEVLHGCPRDLASRRCFRGRSGSVVSPPAAWPEGGRSGIDELPTARRSGLRRQRSGILINLSEIGESCLPRSRYCLPITAGYTNKKLSSVPPQELGLSRRRSQQLFSLISIHQFSSN
jgi:hypothetical protein